MNRLFKKRSAYAKNLPPSCQDFVVPAKDKVKRPILARLKEIFAALLTNW